MSFVEACDAAAYGAEGWSDSEDTFFEELRHVMQRHALPITLTPSLFDKLLDMMTRVPAITEDDDDPIIINQAVCDPEDTRPHLIISGRKIFRMEPAPVTIPIIDGSELIPKKPEVRRVKEFTFYYAAPTPSGLTSNTIYLDESRGDMDKYFPSGSMLFTFRDGKGSETIISPSYLWCDKRTLEVPIEPPKPEPSEHVIAGAAADPSAHSASQSPTPDD